MPTAPKHPCKTPGCGALVDAGFCPSCRSNPTLTHDRPTAHRRGYNYRWQKESQQFLRQHPFAVDYFGEHKGRVFKADCVDHIVPHRGDPVLFWDQSNWQGLTFADHARKTNEEDGGYGNAPKS